MLQKLSQNFCQYYCLNYYIQLYIENKVSLSISVNRFNFIQKYMFLQQQISFVSLKEGIPVPIILKKSHSNIQLINEDSKFLIKNQKNQKIILHQKQIIRLKGVCHQGEFVLAGRTQDHKWQILKKIPIKHNVQRWTLVFNPSDFLDLVYANPYESISQLKRGRPKNFANDNSCSICLQELTTGNENQYVTTDCNHCFHRNCISQWVWKNNCPDCRQILIRKKVKRTPNATIN